MNRLSLHQPASYRLVVDSHIDISSTPWQSNLTFCHGYTITGIPITMLEGILADQVALHSLLSKIRDLGIPLIAIKCLDFDADGNA